MKKLNIAIVIGLFLLAMLIPNAAYAQSAPDPGADWNIKVEFRYTAGEEGKLKIPDSITRFGRNYHLINKQAPVQESLLPAERVYTWHIDGVLTEAEKKQFEETEGVILTPVSIPVQQPADITEILYDLPSNDVEALPNNKEGFVRAAVHFEVQDIDEWNLPSAYTAEVVYRGLETVMESGYYRADSKYTTTEDLGDVAVFVVVATYAPDQIPQTAQTGQSGEGGGGTAGEGGSGTAGESGGDANPVTQVTGDDSTIVADQETPLADYTDNTGGATSLSALIPIILAIVFALICALLLYREYLLRKKKAARRKAKNKARMTYS